MTKSFQSGLAPYMEGLIKQKRADGFSYKSEELLLKRLDTFIINTFPTLRQSGPRPAVERAIVITTGVYIS